MPFTDFGNKTFCFVKSNFCPFCSKFLGLKSVQYLKYEKRNYINVDKHIMIFNLNFWMGNSEKKGPDPETKETPGLTKKWK